MSAFYLSQVLVAIAICFDLLSFQFKERKKIVTCLFFAGVLISSHFILLEQWTAASLMIIATIRYLTSVFSTSPKFKYLFCSMSLVATAFTYSGLISVLSCCASVFQTFAAFNKDDRRLRELMIIGTSFWLVHNYLIGSPTAVVMEALFICSNLVGYYRFYFRKSAVA
ncbi:YgjV family protein [Vibrio lentus]|uniref:YgjV family protein n=1 Tax=Vibrio lentus TaxID=136468 RepID=A0AA44VPI4_9VIBR|nr:YgjV family protein [Vibrio lentus]MCB5361386.1 YgjV family protein [Vibrio lentus]MCB5451361.1 YgjV family protein [Vibrio lentus]MCB5463121.1 YgjV family protein [Vibrio lentus]MCC4794009.1 YgjV family protein [Vibrio lentus]MCC4849529.1 YgjV family protein [Vibrio lentus]